MPHIASYLHIACFTGHMLKSLARRLLKIPVLRYVDDYFGADRLQCAAGALSAFARSLTGFSHVCFLSSVFRRL